MITYNEKERVFKLDTPNTTYMIGIVDEENFVGHIYYGRRLRDADAAYLMRTGEPPFVPSQNDRERCSFYDCFPFERRGRLPGELSGHPNGRRPCGQYAVLCVP